MDVVLFRENTEDVYSGVEYESGTDEANQLIKYLQDSLGANVRDLSGVGIKPISAFGTKRLVRKAIQYAIDNNRKSVTLVHKGNIMKFTEGSFKDWGYELAKEEFPEQTISEDELWDKYNGKAPEGKIVINDRIADNMLQQILTRTDEYDVLALPNLNGDYMSDACAAQIGGLGLAPGANIGDEIALFEATHGTAPKYAGQDKVNPGSVILSGVMMFEHMGWKEVGNLIVKAMEKTVLDKDVTYDLERQIEGANLLKCSEFGDAIIKNMDKVQSLGGLIELSSLPKISVIGAGNVGSSAAYRALELNLADVVLLDIVDGLPQGKALDMTQMMSVTGSSSRIIGTTDYSDTKDSDIVIVTSGLARKPGMSRDDLINTNTKIIKDVTEKVVQHSPNSIIIVVTNPLDAMTYVSYKVCLLYTSPSPRD